MDRSDAIEVVVLSAITTETKASGKVRKVTFLLPNDPGEHPFSGMIGDRLHIVCLKLNDDETSAPVCNGEKAGQGEGERQSSPASSKRKWEDLPPSQQAAIRCNDPEFIRFVNDKEPGADPAAMVRWYCDVASRADLDKNTKAAARWRALDDEFFKWQRGAR